MSIDEVLKERRNLIELLPWEEKKKIREMLDEVFHIPFNKQRNNFYDKIALVDCSLEILGTKTEDQIKAIKMCHRIQNTLSNDEIREGWRVSFRVSREKSHRFFYLNDLIRERRCVSFKCFLE